MTQSQNNCSTCIANMLPYQLTHELLW